MNKEQFNFVEVEDSSPVEQLEMFLEKPELREKFERVRYNVSILGGDKPEEEAQQLGYDLTKNWFSVKTGGYNKGTMKGALEGADLALREMKQDPANEEALSLFRPAIKGITAERFAPFSNAVKGENIKIEAAEGKYSLYLRLGELIEDSEICIILPGEAGTELEVIASLHFDQKLKSMFDIPTKPIIFVGDIFNDLLKKFKSTINKSRNVYKVRDVKEANDLVKKLFDREYLSKSDEEKEELGNIDKDLQTKLLRIE